MHLLTLIAVLIAYAFGNIIGWAVRGLWTAHNEMESVPRINAADVQAPRYNHDRYWYDGSLHNIPPRAD